MDNGVDRGDGRSKELRRAWAKDALGAIALAEGAITERVYVALPAPLRFAERNAFGDAVVVEQGPSVTHLATLFGEQLEEGRRAVLITSAHALGALREGLKAIAAKRIGTVVHAIADRGSADALALADLGWGLLFASSVDESLDLALVARRAAEDCGTPFFVVHERASARHIEAVAPPSAELCEVFVGTPATRVRKLADAAHPVHAKVSERAFAERVQFALGSAMRELESLTGRRKDVIERIPAGDASVMLVALGELGESLVAGVERLRMAGHDVGAVRITALRPFPGPRLVKALSRALAVSVLETVDEPLAQSNPLTRELKAAFADALTWAPEYPGIGRIPRVLSGVVGTAGHELEAGDLDAVVHNMLADERGKRTFVLGADEGLTLQAAPPVGHGAGAGSLSMRGRVRDAATAEACAELCAAVVSSSLGLHVRAAVRKVSSPEGHGAAFDLVASRERPRGLHAPHAVKLVALEDASVLAQDNPLVRLADGGVFAVPTAQRSADAVWGEVPAYAKAIVFDRNARVVGWSPEGAGGDETARPWLTAASFAGLALAIASGRGAVDPSLVAREVAEALLAMIGASGEAIAARGGDAARRVFEAHVEVPRATVERDEEAVRLGRRDVRASAAPSAPRG
jgi:pyruvate/2-oxoacid:ferredoxin oxidoreductase alpha subunit